MWMWSFREPTIFLGVLVLFWSRTLYTASMGPLGNTWFPLWMCKDSSRIWFRMSLPNSCPDAKRRRPLSFSPSLRVSWPFFKVASRLSHKSMTRSSVLVKRAGPLGHPPKGGGQTEHLKLYRWCCIQQAFLTTNANLECWTQRKLSDRYAGWLRSPPQKNNRRNTTTTSSSGAECQSSTCLTQLAGKLSLRLRIRKAKHFGAPFGGTEHYQECIKVICGVAERNLFIGIWQIPSLGW